MLASRERHAIVKNWWSKFLWILQTGSAAVSVPKQFVIENVDISKFWTLANERCHFKASTFGLVICFCYFPPRISCYLNFFFFAAMREEARLLCHMSVWILNSGAVFKLVFTAHLNNSLIMGGNLPYFSANGAEHIASRNKSLPHTLCLLTRVPK